MFQNLSKRLLSAIDRLRGRGIITQADLTQAMREMRLALLEADLALPVVKDLIARVEASALGSDVLKSISPIQMITKIVHDELVEMLGKNSPTLNLNANPPVVILMVGLQGSGKTTTCGKLALHLSKLNKRVRMASLDVYRPAAQQQLEQLGAQIQIATSPIVSSERPIAIAERALREARETATDILILDTAGRQHLDDELMNEVLEIQKYAKPTETILVVDGMTGQDAVRIAQGFQARITLTSLILSRMDGDMRGGAALSIRHITGCPIQFLGTGEKPNQFMVFDAERIAGRILDQGDVVDLVERVQQATTEDDVQEIESFQKRLAHGGRMNFNDMLWQFKKMQKMGGLQSLMSMMPGAQKLNEMMPNQDKTIVINTAIIQSMTPLERRKPEILNASRKKRIAAGSGTSVMHVNRLIKQCEQMNQFTKMMSKDKKGMMSKLSSMKNLFRQ